MAVIVLMRWLFQKWIEPLSQAMPPPVPALACEAVEAPGWGIPTGQDVGSTRPELWLLGGQMKGHYFSLVHKLLLTWQV